VKVLAETVIGQWKSDLLCGDSSAVYFHSRLTLVISFVSKGFPTKTWLKSHFL